MSGFEPLIIGAMVGSTALSATGSIMAGNEKSAAAAYEAERLRIREQQYRTATAQDEARRRDELTANLETIQVMRGGRGVGTSSPTGLSILDSVVDNGERDLRIARTGYLTEAEGSRTAALMADRKSRTSLMAGYIGAGAEVLGSAAKMYGLSQGMSGGSTFSAGTRNPMRLGSLY